MTEMAGMMDTLQRSIPALERSHKQLQDTLQEIVTGVEKQKVLLLCVLTPIIINFVADKNVCVNDLHTCMLLECQ